MRWDRLARQHAVADRHGSKGENNVPNGCAAKRWRAAPALSSIFSRNSIGFSAHFRMPKKALLGCVRNAYISGGSIAQRGLLLLLFPLLLRRLRSHEFLASLSSQFLLRFSRDLCHIYLEELRHLPDL
jgi:hypothetical protein